MEADVVIDGNKEKPEDFWLFLLFSHLLSLVVYKIISIFAVVLISFNHV
jgi:hypothetical protein